MDIKKFAQSFRSSSGKVKIAAISGLVCLVAITMAGIFFLNGPKNGVIYAAVNTSICATPYNGTYAAHGGYTEAACTNLGEFGCLKEQDGYSVYCEMRDGHKVWVISTANSICGCKSGKTGAAAVVPVTTVVTAPTCTRSGFFCGIDDDLRQCQNGKNVLIENCKNGCANNDCVRITAAAAAAAAAGTQCVGSETRCSTFFNTKEKCNNGYFVDDGVCAAGTECFNSVCVKATALTAKEVPLTGTGSKAFFNCAGVKKAELVNGDWQGDVCNPSADNSCGWSGSVHCYCKQFDSENSTSWLYTFDNNLADYCKQCWDRESGSGICNCSYANKETQAVETIPYGKTKCDLTYNMEKKCTNPGQDMYPKPCLNGSTCVDGTGCSNDNDKCSAFSGAVISMVDELNSGAKYILATEESGIYKYSSESKKYWASTADLAIAISVIEKYANSSYMDRIKSHASEFDSISMSDVACANGNNKKCIEKGNRGVAYKCVASPVGVSGCYVWNWLTGGDDNCNKANELADGKYCGYNTKSGVLDLSRPTGACATPPTVAKGCVDPTGAEGKYDCSEDKKPILCKKGSDQKYAWQEVDKATCDRLPVCKDVCAAKQGGSGDECDEDNPCGGEEYCVYDDLNSDTGKCSTAACSSASNPEKRYFAEGAIVCGSAKSNESQECTEPTTPPSAEGWSVTPDGDCTSQGKTCKRETGKCEGKDEPTGECEKLDVTTTGQATPMVQGKCGTISSCSGVCVPFKVTTDKACTAVVCSITNDYDSYNATGKADGGTPSGTWHSCITPKSGSTKSNTNSNSDSENESDTPSSINYTITCRNGSNGPTDKATGQCPFPQGSDNPYQKEEEKKEQAGKEGEKCTKDADCKSGLVCKNGECITKEQDKADNTAPTVSVVSPANGIAVSTKTAELKVVTNLKATCKYMDSVTGTAFSASNFDGNGMGMTSSDGLQHTATLNSLDSNLTSCKAAHSITVLCKNAAATTAGTTQTSAAIGSGQTSFPVDLSTNAEYKPTITPDMKPISEPYDIANPVLKVNTNVPAECEFKEGGEFTYGTGAGKKFDATGSYNHNTQLENLKTKTYDYYVVCRHKETCAANSQKVQFKVALKDSPENAPTIENTTPEIQTIANPTLSITTNLPANCQYKKCQLNQAADACTDKAFTYGDSSAKKFGNDGEYAHTLSLSDYADGTYGFYVACEGKTTSAAKTYDGAIITKISRGGAVGPIISNTTNPNQTTNTPTLTITTTQLAVCQYKEGGEFTWGSGTTFTTDGAAGTTGHSTQLPTLGDGDHHIFVVCKDVATNAVNSKATEIIFTVSTISQTCAKLSSNDKQNDDERDNSDDDDKNSDSRYLWRSVESGSRESFKKVDWYAGYQFTANKDGQVTKLCGYFDEGSNKVSLYSGSYKELASVTIKGTGEWTCASVSPVSVKTDKHYYVIARIKDNPIYYEYKSGLLPRDSEDAVIDAGIRQLATDDFGSGIKKYDYMLFGLVDVRITFKSESASGPEISDAAPVGTVNDKDNELYVKTDKAATCKYSREDIGYSDMKYTFGKTAGTEHEQKICNLDEGPFTFYVRCKETSNKEENDASTLIQFEREN